MFAHAVLHHANASGSHADLTTAAPLRVRCDAFLPPTVHTAVTTPVLPPASASSATQAFYPVPARVQVRTTLPVYSSGWRTLSDLYVVLVCTLHVLHPTLKDTHRGAKDAGMRRRCSGAAAYLACYHALGSKEKKKGAVQDALALVAFPLHTTSGALPTRRRVCCRTALARTGIHYPLAFLPGLPLCLHPSGLPLCLSVCALRTGLPRLCLPPLLPPFLLLPLPHYYHCLHWMRARLRLRTFYLHRRRLRAPRITLPFLRGTVIMRSSRDTRGVWHAVIATSHAFACGWLRQFTGHHRAFPHITTDPTYHHGSASHRFTCATILPTAQHHTCGAPFHTADFYLHYAHAVRDVPAGHLHSACATA